LEDEPPVTAEDLDRLVRRVQQGDRHAFVDVMLAVQRELRIFLSAHASSADMVDEVLQATFVTCYEGIRRYELRGTFLSWLKGIARNLLLRELKEQARYLAVEGDVLEAILVQRGLASVEQANAFQEELLGRLRHCLAQLERTSRQLIEKRYTERMSIRQLAHLFRRTESAVAVTLFRIRQSLRTCLTRSEPAL
jgi:RNA polymerase sigma-70 factor (ECF subfamily)